MYWKLTVVLFLIGRLLPCPGNTHQVAGATPHVMAPPAEITHQEMALAVGVTHREELEVPDVGHFSVD